MTKIFCNIKNSAFDVLDYIKNTSKNI